MTTIRISETYDLSTQVNKMGVIGIHTPTADGAKSMFSGLIANHRYARLVGCDVTIACASMLPADPLQIGTEAGSIAPQDMFNPILYTAVSNDSFNTIQRRLMNNLDGTPLLGSIKQADFDLTEQSFDDFDLYYGLLADADGWRKAMPQSGLKMEGLYPIVYQVLNNFGTNGAIQGDVPVANTATFNATEFVTEHDGMSASTQTGTASSLRGPSMRMPRIPIHINAVDVNWFPQTYVACIIVPPAKLNQLYYRMKVTWTIEFTEVCPTTEYGAVGGLATVALATYATDYADQSSKMSSTTDTVDVLNADIEHVMTSTR